jgi:hypothetical protein
MYTALATAAVIIAAVSQIALGVIAFRIVVAATKCEFKMSAPNVGFGSLAA